MLSDLYLCYQYYLVNKLTLTQGVEIFFSKVVCTYGGENAAEKKVLKFELGDNY